MAGTRIVVVQLKEIIRMVLFALAGLILIIALIWFISPKKNPERESAKYIPGTYTASIVLHNKPVDIVVTVSDDEITAVELKNMEEVQEVFYPLFRPTMDELSKEIVNKQSTSVAIDTDKAVTSRVLLDAVNAALNQAAAGYETSVQ